MNNPTQEQIKEFWEMCGFYQSTLLGSRDWCTPEGEICSHINLEYPPPIDLNNLFRYAVPKLDGGITVQFDKFEDTGWFAHLENQIMTTEDKDPALALFWALRQVRKEAVS